MRRLQCAAAVITVFGVAHWLTATWLFATSEPSISGDHPGMMSEDKLEHKLKLISQSTAKMEVQMSKLLLEVERLQASGTKSGSLGRHRRRAYLQTAGDKLTSSAGSPALPPSHRTGSTHCSAGPDHVLEEAVAAAVVPIWPFTRLCATPNGRPDGLQTRYRRLHGGHTAGARSTLDLVCSTGPPREAAYGERYAAQGDPPHQ